MTRDEKIGLGIVGAIGAAMLTAALWPASDDDRRSALDKGIKTIVQALNGTVHRKRWGMVALDTLEKLVENVLPPGLGFLLGVVYRVEREHIARRIAQPQKHSRALQLALAH
jgi:hypothetical protein